MLLIAIITVATLLATLVSYFTAATFLSTFIIIVGSLVILSIVGAYALDRFERERPSEPSKIEVPPLQACPECKSSEVSYIVYGLPAMNEEFEKMLEDKRVTLGGCTVYEGMPRWVCRNCKSKY